VVWGDAARPEVLAAARPERARLLLLALPDAAASRRILELARATNPAIATAACAHDDRAAGFLAAEAGVGLVVMGEREIALAMAEFAMQRLGLDLATAQETVDALRAEAAG
jgi:CPA2 family monovalent cation:H+ antiporter-2